MRLSKRIAAAGLSPGVARTFAERLAEVATAKGGVDGTGDALITRLLGRFWTPETEPAPFESLWPYGELFLTACLYIAVTDGHYDVEEARVVSGFAHRLGLSATQLSELEARVFGELKAIGARRSGSKAGAGPGAGGGPAAAG
jgi:hypothetical protein